MIGRHDDWSVSIEDDITGIDTVRVTLAQHNRPGSPTAHIVTGITNTGELILTDLSADAMAPAFTLSLPSAVVRAIANIVKPDADAGEVKALREALTIERLRVDEVLTQIVRRPVTP